MAIAILCSVTVSIGELTIGKLSSIFLEKRVLSDTSSTGKSIKPIEIMNGEAS
jgi:hypothetical protein